MIFNPEESVSTQKVFSDFIIKLGDKYKNFVVLDNNVSSKIWLDSFDKVFPDRHFKFGNAFSAVVGSAVSMASLGKVPFVCSYASRVISSSSDLIRNFVCMGNMNVKFVGINAGLLNGEEGAYYQSVDDLAMASLLPNMKVICPADATEARKVIEFMMVDYGPTYLRLFQYPLPTLYDDSYEFSLGKGDIYKVGSDVCLFAIGSGVHFALDASAILEREGISTMVVNMSSFSPIDRGLIVEGAKAVNFVFTVEDHSVNGGLWSKVAEVLAEEYPMRVYKIGVDGFGESGKVDDLCRKYGIDGQSVAERVLEVVRGERA